MNTSTYHKEGLRAVTLDMQNFLESMSMTKFGL